MRRLGFWMLLFESEGLFRAVSHLAAAYISEWRDEAIDFYDSISVWAPSMNQKSGV
jgi:hypothetical protein